MHPDDETADAPVLEVGQFYDIVTELIERRFSKNMPHTIRGEIAKVYEKGHLYLDIVDAGSSSSDARRPVLNAHCWTSKWSTIKRDLDRQGIVLKAGTVVSVTGYADLFAAQGKVGFTITAINVQDLVGDMARRRQELITKLTAENIIGDGAHNKSRPLPPVPLKIGVVASRATEGFADFSGQFLDSPFTFALSLVQTLVQGESAPAQIVDALRFLDTAGLDVICVVRGGGSKGDLSCFDDESVARAIASCTTPVFTGIGHTGDTAIADMAAHTMAITPTKLGETLVTQVRDWYGAHVVAPAATVLAASTALLEQETEFLAERRRTMMFAVRDRLSGEQRHLAALATRLTMHYERVVARAEALVTSRQQLLGAYDPQKRLAQGWALVTTNAGATIRSVDDVTEGVDIRIRLRDGHLGATVTKKEGTQ